MIKIVILVLSLLISNVSMALMKVESGTYQLEGYVGVTDNDVVFLSVNKGSDAQINFLLSGKVAKSLLKKDNHRISALIKVKNDFMASIGSAELVQVKKEIGEDTKVQVYHLPSDLKKIQ